MDTRVLKYFLAVAQTNNITNCILRSRPYHDKLWI